MFECLICGEDMKAVVIDERGQWQPDDEVNCLECGALHQVESDEDESWLVLLKSGAEYIAGERERLQVLLGQAQRYMEHSPSCRIDYMPDLRCTCGFVEAHRAVQHELEARLTNKLRAAGAVKAQALGR